MCEIKKMEINGKVVEFINSARDNRSGFVHESELHIDGRWVGENKCQYYNRTWESYCYQSVMCGLMYDLADERKKVLKEEFLAQKGWKKLTGERKELFEAYCEQDADIRLYKAIHQAL